MTTTYTGLTSNQIPSLLAEYGPNSLPEKKPNFFRKFLHWLISPVSLMLLAAALLSLFNMNLANFFIIFALFLSNFLINIWHEGKADKSIKKLQEKLTLRVKVYRDSKWDYVDSTALLPGDIVTLKIGTVVPADVSILETTNLTINESVLTGESLPKAKNVTDVAYSGSFVTTGQAVGKVVATGAKTNFGKTVVSIDETPRRSSLEKDILSISKFISITSLVVVVLLTAILLGVDSNPNEIITLDLSLLIAGIPVALPTVMSLIISIGVLELAKKYVVVRRLASLEDLANVDLLLSDKTGTLTENRIFVEKIIPIGRYTENDVAVLASSVLSDPENNPLDSAVQKKAEELGVKAYEQISVIPADSERKRNSAIILVNDKRKVVSLGAAQVIESLCKLDPDTKKHFDKTIAGAAENGYRAHVLAVNHTGTEEKDMELVGIMFLADKIRQDAAETIAFMGQHGIEVKMVTGDNLEISKRVVGILGIDGQMYKNSMIHDENWLKENFDGAAGFSEVLPKDKYDLVKFVQKNHTVAVTGDGVNDLPAIKAADVGFAVSNAVDALKSTSDIVLISSGIAVIKDAIIEARKIFTRLYNYSIYRISESFRIIITIAVIGLIFKAYPLTPVQLIILAFLNDIPIVSLAFDRVKTSTKPSHINAKKRLVLSTSFGMVGVANSLILLYIMWSFLHLPWDIIQTVFFLKLTVSGHMLVYLAHTEERWYKFLPSKQVIFATIATQLIATSFAFFGLFTAKISLVLIIIVWVWCFIWMQIGELVKMFQSTFKFNN